jgi:hypothetical protein
MVVSGLRRAQGQRTLGVTWSQAAAAQALGLAAALFVGLVGGCSVDDKPAAGDAGELEQHDAHDLCNGRKCGARVDAGVLELDQVDAGDDAASSDAGDGVLVHDDASVDPTNPDVSDAGPLERDATVADTNDSGELEQLDAGEPLPTSCAYACTNATFVCPSSSSPTGYECRSWPPCDCMM